MAQTIEADERNFLRRLFDAAVAAALPARVVPPHLPPPPAGRLIVLGAGKASAAMARAVEDHWDGPLAGVVVTRYGHAIPCRRIKVVEAGHPLPDAAGADAARRMLAMAVRAEPADLVLALISGGGSSLLSLPAPGLAPPDLTTVNRQLLRSGADIAAINTVRKHLSAIAGGRLGAAAFPAEVLALVISDVPGDDPAVVASGPTLPDPTTALDALRVLARFGITPSPTIATHLRSPAAETPKPGDPRLARSRAIVIASAATSLAAAAESARAAGVSPRILSDAIEGEAREAGRSMAEAAMIAQRQRRPGDPPLVLLSGGETTVTMKGKGRGGRNGEFLAGLALALHGAAGIYALAADTDGIDGTEDNAGALVTPDTLAHARRAGLDVPALLSANDTWPLFATLGDLVVSGPTRTNVNDFRAVLIV